MFSIRNHIAISALAVSLLLGCTAVIGANHSQTAAIAPATTELRNRDQRRWALVIGNQRYTTLTPLRTPPNDVRDMAQVLGELGFQVLAKENLATKADMESAIQEFERNLKTGGVGLFYYSGHGMQVNGNNYLIPVKANIRTLNDLGSEALDIRTVYSAMGNELPDPNEPRDLQLIILDACRSNLLPRISPDGGTSLPGLAPPGVLAPNESIIAYATDPNTGAPEESFGEHSRYTRAILKYIRQPGLRIEEFFKLVKSYVSENTVGDQRPWTTSSVSAHNRNFYFREPAYIRAAIENADDDLILVINGEVVMEWTIDQRTPKSIPLKMGQNTLALFVYNARTFRGRLGRAEGWSYKICFNSKDNLLACFEGNEDRPQTGGPHHGKMFAVASAAVMVDEKSGNVSLMDVNREIWKR